MGNPTAKNRCVMHGGSSPWSECERCAEYPLVSVPNVADAAEPATPLPEIVGTAKPAKTNPLATQVGGGHYKDMVIQPVEFIHANDLGYFEGNVVKYVSRWRKKNGVADLEKARHYIDLLIELESRK